MSTLTISVSNESGTKLENINVSCELYIEYINTSNGNKTLTSRTLAEVSSTTDNKANVSFPSSRICDTTEFIRYWEIFTRNTKKGQSGTFKIFARTIASDPTTTLATSFETISFDLGSVAGKVTESGGKYTLPALTGNKSIIMIAKTSSKVDLDKLEKSFLEKEAAYLQAKRVYEENIKILDTSKIFEQLNDYEPASWEKAISRLLEFEESTLDAALRFTKKTNLTQEFRYLDQIKTAILNFKLLYSDISLSDGEGIPYKG
jgi:hypothetical protein